MLLAWVAIVLGKSLQAINNEHHTLMRKGVTDEDSHCPHFILLNIIMVYLYPVGTDMQYTLYKAMQNNKWLWITGDKYSKFNKLWIQSWN